MTATPDPRIPQATWDGIIVPTCARHGVDPYLIAAIGAHETGQGTLGDGRMPPAGSGHILGVGSYDSGSTSQWAGWAPQCEVGCNTLVAAGVRTAADVAAGKLHVQPNGRVIWASADTARAGFPWSTNVVAIWRSYAKPTPAPAPAPVDAPDWYRQAAGPMRVTNPLRKGGDVDHAGAILHDVMGMGYTPGDGYTAHVAQFVHAFQARHGLQADGQVGPITALALQHADPR